MAVLRGLYARASTSGSSDTCIVTSPGLRVGYDGNKLVSSLLQQWLEGIKFARVPNEVVKKCMVLRI